MQSLSVPFLITNFCFAVITLVILIWCGWADGRKAKKVGPPRDVIHSANLFLMLPTSVVILCWGILANSSRMNCLRWPRLWFGISRTRTALPNWSRRCPMASSCGTFIKSSGSESMFMQTNYDGLVWDRGFWTSGYHSLWQNDAEILLSVSMEFSSETTILGNHWHPSVSLYLVITNWFWFVQKVKATSYMGPWLNHASGSELCPLANRTISWLRHGRCDHGPDRISMLIRSANVCEFPIMTSDTPVVSLCWVTRQNWNSKFLKSEGTLQASQSMIPMVPTCGIHWISIVHTRKCTKLKS